MTSDKDVLALLHQAIERVGAENLVRRPGLARNVFGDMFPADPLVVSLLSAAVESGAVGRLLDDSDDLEIVAPRLADGMASSRGIVAQHARWAVDIWAVALGRSERMPPPLEQPGSGAGVVHSLPGAADDATRPAESVTETVPADPPGASSTRTASSPPESRTTPHAAAPADDDPTLLVGTSATGATRPGPGSGSQVPTERLTPDPRPGAPAAARAVSDDPPRRRRARLVPIVAAVAVAVLVVGVTTAVLLSTRRSSSQQSQDAMTAEVLPALQGADAAVTVGMASKNLGGKAIPLKNGDGVSVTTGPVEVRIGKSLVRLASNTKVTFIARTKTEDATLIVASPGAVYASVVKGEKLDLRPQGVAEHVQLTTGRFAMACTPRCDYYTLDERQTVHVSKGDSMSAVTMLPLQHMHSSVAAGTKMQMPAPSMSSTSTSSPSPSSSGGMSGMDMGGSTSDSKSANVTPVLADFLRYDPWVGANLKRDADEHRLGQGKVSGVSLVGQTWTFMLDGRDDVAAPVHRVVRFGKANCIQFGCIITARTKYRDPSGHLQDLKGNVYADTSPDAVRIAYDDKPAACGTFGKADGMESIADLVDFAAGTGHRVTTYTPDSGVQCAQRKVPTPNLVPARGDMTGDSGTFTRPGATEDLVVEHTMRASKCDVASGSFGGLEAGIECDLGDLDKGNPRTIELYRFSDVGALRDAYDSFSSQSGWPRDTGNCDGGKCEQAIPEGRRLIYGSARFVQTNEPQLLLIVATGNTTPDLGKWLKNGMAQDVAVDPRPVLGL